MDLKTAYPGFDLNALEKRVGRDLKNIRDHGLMMHKGRKCLTGYSYRELYDWDLYFENLFLCYAGEWQYCVSGVETFLDSQLPSGFVSRTAGVMYQKPRHHFKPFLAQTALLGSSQSGDFRWLSGKYYERLVKYLDYWFWYCDLDKNGLCVWDGSDHSGMDNQALRLGYDGVMEVEGVDLNCYLYRELCAMEVLSQKLGLVCNAVKYRKHADRLAKLINDVFWDEQDGFYYDRNERTGKPVSIKSIAGLLPLWLGIVPRDRAERLVKEHITNPEEFWLEYPLATWAKNEPGYYQQRLGDECAWMGATWIPTNYMVFHGLIRYGYRDIARELALKTYALAIGNPETREYYNGETGAGQGLNPFWGWSTLAYVMPAEFELGYDPTELDRTEFVRLFEMVE